MPIPSIQAFSPSGPRTSSSFISTTWVLSIARTPISSSPSSTAPVQRVPSKSALVPAPLGTVTLPTSGGG
jgi:hypothetical protein